MADIQYAPDMGAPVARTPVRMGTIVNLAGAVVSVALIGGIGVWGYKLMMRDVSGVPVVRALEGPMRVQPDNPGGRPADHQGLAVNAVAAEGEAAPTPDQIALAPRPVSLQPEDQPVDTSLRAPTPPEVTTPATAPGDDAQPQETEALTDASVSNDAVTAFQNGSVEALVDQLTQGVAPLGEATAPDGPAPEVVVLVPQEQADTPAADPIAGADAGEAPAAEPVAAPVIDAPGVRRSLRPVARPATLAPQVSQIEEVAAVTGGAALDLDPASLPAGTRLAQLGAYDSPEIAKSEWGKIVLQFDDYFDGKQRVVQQASSGGRTFYRLRAAGFDDLSDARRFCSALVAGGTDCIPVVTR